MAQQSRGVRLVSAAWLMMHSPRAKGDWPLRAVSMAKGVLSMNGRASEQALKRVREARGWEGEQEGGKGRRVKEPIMQTWCSQMAATVMAGGFGAVCAVWQGSSGSMKHARCLSRTPSSADTRAFYDPTIYWQVACRH